MTRRGLTLIETLAAIVLVGLAFALVSRGWTSTDDATQLGSFAAQILDLDDRARVLARAADGVTVSFDEQRSRVVLKTDAETITQLSVRDGWNVVLTHASTPVTSISFDRTGRSVDYTITCRSPLAKRVFSIAGLTGATLEHHEHDHGARQ